MSTKTESIEKITLRLCAALFETGGGDYAKIESDSVNLAAAINAAPDDGHWYFINECGAAGPGDLVEGLYWHFAEWHGGQWSDGYAALSALGSIYQPAGNGPEGESSAALVYQSAGELAENLNG